MSVYGFDDGKNKQPVYKTSEILPLVHEEFDPLINAKQDQHTRQTVTLAVANWNNKSQTVSVTGVTASNTVFVSPAPASAGEYSGFGVLCTTQGEGSLAFSCDFTPENDISVNVVVLNQGA